MTCGSKITTPAVAVVMVLLFPLQAPALATVMPGLQTQMGMEVDCDVKTERCGWELMEKQEIPISTLGSWYAHQTHDRSLCTPQPNGTEYCTCILECGNGVWMCEEEKGKTSVSTAAGMAERAKKRRWRWVGGCGKYCHGGVCDGQDGDEGERTEM
ncbi:hypothetical protein Ptr902_07580 [Pyrenophora tritici-repentis]|uniref:Uncharacterized protein n=1 Tax=Pyrenophora tritici-repentis TaxID=45151 RepID=A0A834S0M6_9PLEO|nr:hypothetical protein A1F99_052380 [Pyrenophora tritici-repentis]KAF7573240.1 hypothetical protein PtrM4_081450 [Pyrenophora tritici-repentis]KAI0583852.1 hypothetical protein Alg215_03380 [Pyrenophora tritici-repentis]KAI0617943.1 hypothetical protein TUN199_10068 [Pyrenophora tritici-repentis]KAI2480555.1 hypothetical protein Ptr902_07580 [Pyrenophora tritici-repentis]